jgi:YVTN family beta-propeller protein
MARKICCQLLFKSEVKLKNLFPAFLLQRSKLAVNLSGNASIENMKYCFLFLFLWTGFQVGAQKPSAYTIARTYHIASTGGWDYLALNDHKVYVAHGTQVNILNEENGDSVGIIPNTNGVHGIAFDNASGRGYTSNGRANNVTVFDLKTNRTITQIATGENPDAIIYEPFTKSIITCNGRGRSLSVIDPHSNTVIATIEVGGKPEAAVADGRGLLYVNVEDKNEIVVVDIPGHAVLHHWSLTPGEAPTGLAYDPRSKRLFAGCEKLLVVLNAENGKQVDAIKIGDGCDGVAFDNKKKLIYTSNGEGTISVISEITPDKYLFIGNYNTKRGARTIALDEAKGEIFLPTADFEPPTTTGGRPRMIPGSFQVLVVRTSN